MDHHLQRHELFVVAATLAAHANAGAGYFRQRDLRFLIELFSNWVETSFTSDSLVVQNTQIQRYVESLVRDGYARKEAKGTRPGYRLSRLGLLELLQRIHAFETRVPEHRFFILYFLMSYRQKLAELVQQEGTRFPPALRIEIEALLDGRSMLRDEITRVETELRKIRERIRDSEKAAEIAESKFRKGEGVSNVVRLLEETQPYQLNSRKPLSELVESIPPDIARWELVTGNRARPRMIWSPTKEMLERYLRCLKEMDSSV